MSPAERNTYLRHLEAMQNEKSATQYSYASGKVDGRLEGIEEGRAEGRADAMREMAKKMLSDGMTLELAAKYSGLTLDEIEKI